MKYLGPISKDLTGPGAEEYLAQARVLLGQVRNDMALGGTKQGWRSYDMPNGVKIRVYSNQTGAAPLDMVYIDVPPRGGEQKPGQMESGYLVLMSTDGGTVFTPATFGNELNTRMDLFGGSAVLSEAETGPGGSYASSIATKLPRGSFADDPEIYSGLMRLVVQALRGAGRSINEILPSTWNPADGLRAKIACIRMDNQGEDSYWFIYYPDTAAPGLLKASALSFPEKLKDLRKTIPTLVVENAELAALLDAWCFSLLLPCSDTVLDITTTGNGSKLNMTRGAGWLLCGRYQQRGQPDEYTPNIIRTVCYAPTVSECTPEILETFSSIEFFETLPLSYRKLIKSETEELTFSMETTENGGVTITAACTFTKTKLLQMNGIYQGERNYAGSQVLANYYNCSGQPAVPEVYFWLYDGTWPEIIWVDTNVDNYEFPIVTWYSIDGAKQTLVHKGARGNHLEDFNVGSEQAYRKVWCDYPYPQPFVKTEPLDGETKYTRLGVGRYDRSYGKTSLTPAPEYTYHEIFQQPGIYITRCPGALLCITWYNDDFEHWGTGIEEIIPSPTAAIFVDDQFVDSTAVKSSTTDMLFTRGAVHPYGAEYGYLWGFYIEKMRSCALKTSYNGLWAMRAYVEWSSDAAIANKDVLAQDQYFIGGA